MEKCQEIDGADLVEYYYAVFQLARYHLQHLQFPKTFILSDIAANIEVHLAGSVSQIFHNNENNASYAQL